MDRRSAWSAWPESHLGQSIAEYVSGVQRDLITIALGYGIVLAFRITDSLLSSFLHWSSV